jgi:drug/metabolite transporter (DMT)-like permease
VDARAASRPGLRRLAVLLLHAGLAAILGFLFWGDVPTLTLLLGSSIVVGSGLFLLWRESAVTRRK